MPPIPQAPYEQHVSEPVMTSPVNLTSTDLDDINAEDPKVTAALAKINTAFSIGIEEARSLSQVLSRQISKDYDILCGILNLRGELIYNRWLNKKKTSTYHRSLLFLNSHPYKPEYYLRNLTANVPRSQTTQGNLNESMAKNGGKSSSRLGNALERTQAGTRQGRGF